MKHNPVNQFLFRRSFLEAVSNLPEKEKLATLVAIIEYGLNDCNAWGITTFEQMNKRAFCQCMEQLIEDSIRIRDDVERAAKKSENFGKEGK